MGTVADEILRANGGVGELAVAIMPLPADRWVNAVCQVVGEFSESWLGTDGRSLWIGIPYDWQRSIDVTTEVSFPTDGTAHQLTIQWGNQEPRTYRVEVDLRICRMEVYLENGGES